jgi:alkanesulfonate monooxygenase SsuD/methylene tetrahydromethanopterin reductase-like flavin-dependent oxidoreductase (luciferase family)
LAAPLLDAYLHSLVAAAADWLDGHISEDYPGYDKIIAGLSRANAADLMASGAAWVGSPDEIAATIARVEEDYGGFEHASVQVNFNMLPLAEALASMRLFAQQVMPRFSAG